MCISNAPDADVYSVFARTTAGAGARGLTAFAVPRDARGPARRAASSCSPRTRSAGCVFDGVARPGRARARRGRRRLRGSRCGRSTCSARASARSPSAWRRRRSTPPSTHARTRAGVRPAAAATSRRSRTGSPTSPTRVQAARLLVHQRRRRATTRGVRPTTQAAAMAKLFATETAQEAVDVAIQVHGARGAGARATCSSTSTARCGRRGSTRARPRSSARSSPAQLFRR